MNKKYIRLALILSAILAPIFFFLIPYLVTQTKMIWSFDQSTGVIGDTIGGIVGPIVGFMAVVLTFLAFYVQYEANEEQKKQFKFQQFENIFFELLKLHRENVGEMRYRNAEGREVMVKIVDELFELFSELNNYKDIPKENLSKRDLANIAYLILFFGVSNTLEDTLQNRFQQHYSLLYAEIMEFSDSLRGKKHNGNYYYHGHQSRLGHYFRHMFAIVKYVHGNSNLSDIEKKKYLKIFRAQLSTHEQILLFFNSISDLGADWELRHDISKEDALITKYNLIRNIPLGSIWGFNPKVYYPDIELENDYDLDKYH